MGFIQKIGQILGIGTAIIGFLFLAIGIATLFDEKLPETSTMIMMFVLGIFLLISGIILYRKSSQNLKQINSRQLENEIIKVANSLQYKGKITVTDVVIATGKSLETIKQELEKLHIKGVFDINLTDNGAIVYQLRGYATSTDKHHAV